MVTPKKIIMKDLELADKEIARLRKENEELREHKENLIRADKKKTEYIDKLEKENKELKKELKKYKHYYDRDKEELMESCYALAKENDELKKELEKFKTDIIYEEGLYN